MNRYYERAWRQEQVHSGHVDTFHFYRHVFRMCRFFRVSSTYPPDMSMARTCIENAIFLSHRKVYVQKNGFSTHIGLLQFHLKSAYFGGFGLTHWGIMCRVRVKFLIKHTYLNTSPVALMKSIHKTVTVGNTHTAVIFLIEDIFGRLGRLASSKPTRHRWHVPWQ